MEGGAAHRYDNVVLMLGAPSHIYIGGMEGGREEQPKEAPK